MSVPALDFKKMGVISITRCDSMSLKTQVLYQQLYGTEGQLVFKCSNEEHDALALEFKQYLEKRNDTTQ